MRVIRFLALLCLFHLASCVSTPSSSDEIVGTWRWIRVDSRGVEKPFYLRFYPNGTAVSWPAPSGISRGRYSAAGGVLILDTGSGKFDPRARFRIKGGQLTVTNEDGHRLEYRRVLPTLEPGRYESTTSAATPRSKLREESALRLASQAARNAGIDTNHYHAPTVRFRPRDGVFWVHYAGKQARPGNHLSVRVDHETRRTEVFRGQ